MTLRINVNRTSVDVYRKQLSDAGVESHPGDLSPVAVYLASPTVATELPDFAAGFASVQDEASQLVAPLLELKPGLRVLDACAAPGGKTCHMLEIEPDIELTALDVDQGRLRQVRQNLIRLGVDCSVVEADLRRWHCDKPFDRILLDAPCSATGIIRRHPDIKLLRRESDIAKLVSVQLQLLQAAWRLLKPEGVLVYSTCSILPAENEEVIDRFIAENSDAAPLTISASWGIGTGTGRQLHPVIGGHDGFYYARLVKRVLTTS